MMKNLAVIGLVLIMLIGVVTPLISAAGESEIPVLPNKFWGNVTLNGEDLSSGYMIKAYIDGEIRGIVIVTNAGKYGDNFDYLKVDGSGSDAGKTITFTVAGVAVSETAEWHAMASPEELDLTAEGEPTETPVPTPTPRPTSNPTVTATQEPESSTSDDGEDSSPDLGSGDGVADTVMDTSPPPSEGIEVGSDATPGGTLRTVYGILIIEAILIAIGITGILFYFAKKRRGGMQ
ncbi:MAG: hypothetical protein SYNGOMJ08_00806 [Candidatus Syntrophoarchaeum sp. GoM_oil]|nr:MAG: hypothetical protein SYNGOMJ08_00806 [Candidatus Syntrophoarchaeum sp. GoM_oil]